MRQFAFEPDVWIDAKGGKFDPRFINFFGGDATKFLETLDADAKENSLVYKEALQKIQEIFEGHMGKMDQKEIDAQIRFHIFQEHIAPIMNGVREANIENRSPSQTDFTTGAPRPEFDRLFGRGASGNVLNMMKKMSEAVVSTDNAHAIPGVPNSKNNLIGRLAFDPTMMQALYRSPLTLVDVPYWMLHGSDPHERNQEKRTHPADIKNLYGGSNQFGRAIGYVKDSTQSRMALTEIAKADFNHFEETIFKPLDVVIKTNAALISKEFAAQIKIGLVGKLYKLMTPELAELVGAQSLPIANSSEMRKLFNRLVRGTTEEEAKNWFQQNAHTFQRKQYVPLAREIFFGSKFKRTYRSLWKIFFALLLISISQAVATGGEIFQGELKAV